MGNSKDIEKFIQEGKEAYKLVENNYKLLEDFRLNFITEINEVIHKGEFVQKIPENEDFRYDLLYKYKNSYYIFRNTYYGRIDEIIKTNSINKDNNSKCIQEKITIQSYTNSNLYIEDLEENNKKNSIKSNSIAIDDNFIQKIYIQVIPKRRQNEKYRTDIYYEDGKLGRIENTIYGKKLKYFKKVFDKKRKYCKETLFCANSSGKYEDISLIINQELLENYILNKYNRKLSTDRMIKIYTKTKRRILGTDLKKIKISKETMNLLNKIQELVSPERMRQIISNI